MIDIGLHIARELVRAVLIVMEEVIADFIGHFMEFFLESSFIGAGVGLCIRMLGMEDVKLIKSFFGGFSSGVVHVIAGPEGGSLTIRTESSHGGNSNCLDADPVLDHISGNKVIIDRGADRALQLTG